VYKVKPYKVNENDLKILRILLQNSAGLLTKSIQNYTNLKRPVVYKRLEKLKKNKIIENIYPIWRISNGQVDFCRKLLSSDIFELHNISYVLKLLNPPEWWGKRKNRLMKLKGYTFTTVSFGKGESNPYEQLMNENFVIQTYPESIIIISRKRYYSNNPYNTIIQAIEEVMDLISFLEERFRFKLLKNGFEALEIRNNDFNRIKDYLAEHCKKEGRKFLVELDKNRKVWVDYSEPFGKEANYPEAQEILEKHTKDLLMNKPLLNSEIQDLVKQNTEQINQLTGIQKTDLEKRQEYSNDLLVHKEAIRQMGNNTEANTKSIELLSDVISNLIGEIKKLEARNT
jgi:DNA-binding Lrp family transcriptional regulator